MSFAPNTAPEFHEERAALIAELYANISLGNGVMEGTPETQAFLWLGDAGCLRALVEESRGSPRVARSLLGGALQSTRVVDTWLANTRESKSKRGQKRKAKDMAGDGDERCTVTEAEGPLDIAHIYPFCLNGRTHLDSQVMFWNVLGHFWPEAKIEAWKRAILGEEGTEHPRNMLSLAPHVHKYWGKALFALKPLEQLDDGKSLTAEFHWLKQRTGEKSVTLTEMPTLATAIDSPGCCIKLWNNRTEQKIVTGHQVVFRTDDPIEHPLPSWELLEMQWHLQRVAAMAGASEQDDEEDEESDSDSDSDSDNDDGGDDHSFPSARRQSLSLSTRRASLPFSLSPKPSTFPPADELDEQPSISPSATRSIRPAGSIGCTARECSSHTATNPATRL